MLELREKEVENKTKKIHLQKMETVPTLSTIKSASGVTLKSNKHLKSRVVLDRSIKSDA